MVIHPPTSVTGQFQAPTNFSLHSCHLPPATWHMPPATCHLPHATCHQPPSVSISATCHRQSPLSTYTTCQLQSTNYFSHLPTTIAFLLMPYSYHSYLSTSAPFPLYSSANFGRLCPDFSHLSISVNCQFRSPFHFNYFPSNAISLVLSTSVSIRSPVTLPVTSHLTTSVTCQLQSPANFIELPTSVTS